MLDIAIALAAKKFMGVFDKGGRPYILHCLWVMNRVRHLGDDVMIIAILHDVVEDTDVTLEDLERMDFSENIVASIDAITKRPEETYADYLARLQQDPDAIQVKLRDLEHNSKITRWKYVDDRVIKLIKKYNLAYNLLKKHRK